MSIEFSLCCIPSCLNRVALIDTKPKYIIINQTQRQYLITSTATILFLTIYNLQNKTERIIIIN